MLRHLVIILSVKDTFRRPDITQSRGPSNLGHLTLLKMSTRSKCHGILSDISEEIPPLDSVINSSHPFRSEMRTNVLKQVFDDARVNRILNIRV